jgi:anti-sigma B factor antagonist
MDNVSNGALAALATTVDGQGVRVLRITGELDISSVPGVEADLTTAIEHDPGPVVFDLSDLAFMDSSGIAMLLRAAAKTGPLTIQGASRTIRHVIEVTGLTDVLRVES